MGMCPACVCVFRPDPPMFITYGGTFVLGVRTLTTYFKKETMHFIFFLQFGALNDISYHFRLLYLLVCCIERLW